MKTRSLIALFAVLAAQATSAQSLTFTSFTYAVGDEDSGPDCVAVADVNGDGKPDLISANYGFRWGLPGDPGGWNTNLVVLTNNGSGGFSLDAVLIVGRGPSFVAAMDVNGDAKPDLISANETDNSLTVLTNNGSGGFGNHVTLIAGNQPHGLAVTDLNGDGMSDLVCVNTGDDTLTMFTNQGGGGFAFSATLTTGDQPLAVIAMQSNGDGKLDLVAANKNSDSLTVLTNDGSGEFSPSATLAVGHFPDSVSAADFNGDGKVDLVSVNWGDATMTVLTNNGSGGFGFNATLAVGGHPSTVAAADFNGDGHADLICASTDADSLRVLTNNGAGVFGYNTTLATGRIPNVWPAHFNNDGKLDLACPNFRDGTVTVLLNTTVFPNRWTTNNLLPGCIAWWRAEGNMLDSVGPHDGAGSATPTYAPGRFGQAFRFNGMDQSVMIPDGYADLDGWTQFTLEAWINADIITDSPTPGAGRCIFSKVGTPGHRMEDNFGYQLGFGNNGRSFVCLFNTSGQIWPGLVTSVIFDLPLPTNTWLHIAATYDHNAVKLYLNGLPLVTNVVGPVTIANSPSSLRLSKDDNMNVPFAGGIDEARIYNRALTETEIAALAMRITLVNVGHVGTNFTFAFQTVSNFNYAIEANDDLNTTNWQFLQAVSGDGSLLPCVVPMANGPQRFFRVRQP